MKKYNRDYSTIEPNKLVELFNRLPKYSDNSVNTLQFIKLIQTEASCSSPTAYKFLRYQDECFKSRWGRTKLLDNWKIKELITATTAHKQKIKEVADCLDHAIPIDSLRPDVLGFYLTPEFLMYAVEVQTNGGGFEKLKKYEKQTAVKYVIYVDLKNQVVKAVSLFDKEKPLPNSILDVIKKIQDKLFGVLKGCDV